MITLLFVMLCLFLNGIFSSFEMAYITIAPERLNDLIKKHSRLQILNVWKKKPERIFSTIQIGITFVGGLAAVVGGAQWAESFSNVLTIKYAFHPTLSKLTSIFLIIFPLTYLNVVFGELFPKAIALRIPEKVLLRLLFIIVFMDKFLSPIISFLEKSTHFLVNLLRLRAFSEDGDKKISINNLKHFHQRYVIDLVKLKEKSNQDIIVPWHEVIKLDLNSSKDEVMKKITEFRHTRLPVTKDGKVVGVLNTKEFIVILNDQDIPWQSMIRPILKFSAKQSALMSLKEMQATQNHIAWISDEKENVLGMITMEDILEEFLGNILDEDDDDRLRQLIEMKRGL